MKKLLSLFAVFALIIVMGAGCNKQDLEGSITPKADNWKVSDNELSPRRDNWSVSFTTGTIDNIISKSVSSTDITAKNLTTDNLLVNIMATTTDNLYVGGNLEVVATGTFKNDLVVEGNLTASTIEIDNATGFFKIFNPADPTKYGQLDHDGSYFNISSSLGQIWMKNATVFQSTMYYGGISGVDSFIRADSSYDQLQFGLGSNYGTAMVLGASSFYDYDHAVQTNPTLFGHSVLSPDTDNSRWWSLTHTGTAGDTGYAELATGAGDLFLNPETGFVGIGTSTPSYSLDVINNQNSGTEIRITNDTDDTVASTGLSLISGGNSLLLKSYADNHSTKGGENWIYSTASGEPIVFGLNSTGSAIEKMRITSDGYVGIGTSTPSDKLHIVSDTVGTAFFDRSFTADNNTPRQALELLRSYDGTGGADGIGGNIDFAFEDSTGFERHAAQIQWIATDAGAATFNTDLAFNTATNGGAVNEKLRITGDGKVGIGTSTPRSNLDLNAYYFPDVDGTNGQVLKTNGSGALTWQEDSSITDGTATGQTTVWDGSDWTATSSLMVVGEKVGIGTDSPNSSLHVSGTDSESARIEVDRGAGIGQMYIGSANDFGYIQTPGDDDIVFYLNGSEYVRFGSDGKVGIGTSTPAFDLQVAGGTTTSTMSVGVVGAKAGCIPIQDTDLGGWTYCTTLNGTLSCSADSCL